MRIWIVGPIAWDTVLYLNNIPETGGFTHAKKHEERPGGQALNIATALANSGFNVGLCGYVGNDAVGSDLLQVIANGKIDTLSVKVFEHPTPHVIVMVDQTGERTMIGMEKSYFGEIEVDVNLINSEDLVVWPIWRTGMNMDYSRIKEKGCKTIVGLGALNEDIAADIAIGSAWELPNEFEAGNFIKNFPRIIATNNEKGSIEFTENGEQNYPAISVRVVDTTGAGDAFICGIVKAFVEGKSNKEAIDIAATWSARTVESHSSVPITWN